MRAWLLIAASLPAWLAFEAAGFEALSVSVQFADGWGRQDASSGSTGNAYIDGHADKTRPGSTNVMATHDYVFRDSVDRLDLQSYGLPDPAPAPHPAKIVLFDPVGANFRRGVVTTSMEQTTGQQDPVRAPEPAALGLVALGTLGIRLIRRRRPA